MNFSIFLKIKEDHGKLILNNFLISRYRLLPEGIDFKKEISIENDYSAVSIPASLNKVLRLGYQDQEGYIHSPKMTKKVAGKQIITAKTKHFSDWFLYSSYELKPVGRQ